MPIRYLLKWRRERDNARRHVLDLVERLAGRDAECERLQQACDIFEKNSADATAIWDERNRLQDLNRQLAERVAAQTELLARRAEREMTDA